jgi:hypothetical protein
MKKNIAIILSAAGTLSLASQAGAVAVYDAADNITFDVIADPSLALYPTSPAGATASWTQALGEAAAFDPAGSSHLAIVLDGTEETAIQSAITLTGVSGEVWAGAYQNPITETTSTVGWTWINGTTFPGYAGQPGTFGSSYSYWSSGEPNDNYGPGSEQYLGLSLHGLGGWNDEGNPSLIAGYVVEYNGQPVSTPDGGMTAGLLGSALIGLATLRRKLVA